MATVDTLNLNLNGNSKQAVSALNNLIKALKKFETEVSPERLGAVANGFKSINKSIGQISTHNINKVERLAAALEKISKAKVNTVSKSVKSAGSNANKVSNSVKQAVENVATPAAPTGGSKGTSIQAETKKIEEATEKVSAMTKITSTAKEALAVMGKGVTAFGKVIGNVLKPLAHFVKSLARVAFYRFIRGILKAITDGLREGMQNLVLYSKALDGLDTHNANEVMSRYASAFLYFKNAIATAVIPVLRALVPVIEQAMFRLVDFVNLIAQIGSSFFGTEYTKAKYFWVDYADSIDKATGSAKELNHQLANFDELNNLNDNRNSGSGSGSVLPNAEDMFEKSKISDKIMGFVNKVKQAFKDIYSVISPTLDKLKEIWNGIKEKVAPNLERIWANLKRIWAVVKPLLIENAKGFLEGFFGQEFESLPDALGFLSEKLADLTDKVADWFEKLDLEKLKEWENKVGKVGGAITFLLSPLGILLSYLDIQNSRLYQWGVQLGFVMGYNITKFVLDLKQAIEKAIEKFKDIYDKTLNLNNSTSVLSTNIQELKDKFNAIKDKAKEFTDKLFNMVTEITNVKKKAEALKEYWNNHNIFENVIATGAMFLYTISQIQSVLDVLKRIGEIVIKLTISIANGGALDDIINKISSISNNVKEAVEDALSKDKDDTNSKAKLDDTVKKRTNDKKTSPTATGANKKATATGGNYGGYGSLDEYIKAQKKKALGGVVPMGDLFIANERGAEMVGSIGGNTAVANNDQITEAIATAAYNAMSRALSENGQNVNIVVEGDGDKMFKVFQKKQRDWQRTTGLAY